MKNKLGCFICVCTYPASVLCSWTGTHSCWGLLGRCHYTGGVGGQELLNTHWPGSKERFCMPRNICVAASSLLPSVLDHPLLKWRRVWKATSDMVLEGVCERREESYILYDIYLLYFCLLAFWPVRLTEWVTMEGKLKCINLNQHN